MFFMKLVMSGLFYWLPFYLQELNFEKTTSLNIYSLFSTGSFFGNVIMGLSSDILPIRSPIFLFGAAISCLLTILISIYP